MSSALLCSGTSLGAVVAAVPRASCSSQTYLLRRRSPLASSSSSQRLLHASSVRRFDVPADGDLYKTLGVGKNASQQDIKAQFYKLSKQWHPDVNQGSEESKQKFQQVSEAYATLSHESARKQYDRQRSGSGFGVPRAARDGGARYNSDNLQRRATASYAWEYQRRNAARAHKRANAGDAASTSSHGRTASSSSHAHHQFGTGGVSDSTKSSAAMFERLAEQQRKREAAAAERLRRSGQATMTPAMNEEQASGGGIRFLQIAVVMGFISFFVAQAVNKQRIATSAKRRPI